MTNAAVALSWDEDDGGGDSGNDNDSTIGPGDTGGGKRENGLRLLHSTSISVEKFRIQMSNRIDAEKRGSDTNTLEVKELYDTLFVHAKAMEDEVDRLIARRLKQFPVYMEWLRHVKGIGPSLAGQMLAMLLPPLPNTGPSTWYKAAGLAPEEQEDGKFRLPRARTVRCPKCQGTSFRNKLVADPDDPDGVAEVKARVCSADGCGEVLPPGYGRLGYHPGLRRSLYNVALSFVMGGGYYRQVYEQQKARLFALHSWKANELLVAWKSTSPEARQSWMESRYAPEMLTRRAKGAKADDVKKLRARYGLELVQTAIGAYCVEPTYDKAIDLTSVSDPAWPLIRIDQVARWGMIRLFLSHLYERMLETEGVTGRRAYVLEKLGHTHYIPPPEVRMDGKKI